MTEREENPQVALRIATSFLLVAVPMIALISKGHLGAAVLVGLLALAGWGVALMFGARRARQREELQRAQLADAAPDYAVAVRWRASHPIEDCLDDRTPDVAGILTTTDDTIALATREGGVRRTHRLDRSRTQIRWVGRTRGLLPCAAWIALDMDGRRLLVTAETGTLPFGSRRATREIYEQLVQRSASPAAVR